MIRFVLTSKYKTNHPYYISILSTRDNSQNKSGNLLVACLTEPDKEASKTLGAELQINKNGVLSAQNRSQYSEHQRIYN